MVEGRGREGSALALLPRGLNPLGTRNFKGFFKGGRGWGLSLYRLPAFCHADGLIHAVRFFRKEKSSLLRAGDFLRRTQVPAQSTLGTFCVAVSAPPMGMNFFFTKKWVGGRSTTKEVSARQGVTSLYRLEPPPPLPLTKTGIQGGPGPLGGGVGAEPPRSERDSARFKATPKASRTWRESGARTAWRRDCAFCRSRLRIS